MSAECRHSGGLCSRGRRAKIGAAGLDRLPVVRLPLTAGVEEPVNVRVRFQIAIAHQRKHLGRLTWSIEEVKRLDRCRRGIPYQSPRRPFAKLRTAVPAKPNGLLVAVRSCPSNPNKVNGPGGGSRVVGVPIDHLDAAAG